MGLWRTPHTLHCKSRRILSLFDAENCNSWDNEIRHHVKDNEWNMRLTGANSSGNSACVGDSIVKSKANGDCRGGKQPHREQDRYLKVHVENIILALRIEKENRYELQPEFKWLFDD
jgi:hypothetical protein